MSSLESLEQKESHLFSLMHNLPNGDDRSALYVKWKKVYDQLTVKYIKDEK